MATALLERYWKWNTATKTWSLEFTKGYLKAHPEAAQAKAKAASPKK